MLFGIFSAAVRLMTEAEKKGESSVRELEDVGIRFAARMIAAASDKNSVTAAYTAIPLAEDILRHYVCLVLELSPLGSAFEAVDAHSINAWWKQPKAFKPPEKAERLSGTHLAILAGVISAQRGRPLFLDLVDLSRFLSLLDERNISAHHVTTPTDQANKDLFERIARLLDRMFLDGGSHLTVREIANWFRAPLRFLRASPNALSS